MGSITEKLQLPSVTLLCWENRDVAGSVDLLHRMCQLADFGAVRLINWHKGYEAFCYYENFEAWRYVTTDHVLVVHLDGYILRPELWRPSWLSYDYIGAPWPEEMNPDRVGNGGFCLKSRRLMNRVAQLSPAGGAVGDVLVCSHYRQQLIKEGFKFAPVVEAARFSVEHLCPETPPETFGFHGFGLSPISPPALPSELRLGA